MSMRSLSWFTILLMAAAGCGTTKWSDSARTATEQLLISTAVDRAIDNMDFTPLRDKHVYLDPQYLDCVDNKYVFSTLRQHMLSEGCVLMPNADSADYVVEVRSGTVGTDHHDVLLGIPAISVPGAGMAGAPSAIPEIPFAKTTAQKGVAKLACFAYDRETGQAVWQSGTFPVVSTAKDSWFFGTGPFQRGTIYDSTHFAGSRFLITRKKKDAVPLRTPEIQVSAKAEFRHRPALVRKTKDKTAATGQASPATPPAPGKPAGPPAVANPATTSGSSGPSLSSGLPPAAGANAGVSTGLPSGQVVRLPALPQPSSSGGKSASDGVSLNPSSWLRLK